MKYTRQPNLNTQILSDMKLHGIRVLDFSQFMAGPLISSVLADHGADVVKIESRTGDPTRRAGPGSSTVASDFFAALNRGKRSLSIDLKAPGADMVLRRLVEEADVLIESFSPGVTDRLGIDYPSLRAWNPRLVYCSVTAFGQSGPMRDVPSHDQLVQAMAGTYARTGDGVPVAPVVPVAGAVSAYAALSGILIALIAARNGEGGDHLDFSMFDAMLTTRPTAIGHALQALEAPENYEYRTGIALLETYRTADARWISLGAHEPRFASALLGSFGREDLVPLATGAPGDAQNPVRQFLADTFLTRDLDFWLRWARENGLSLGPVLNFAQALGHPHTHAREMLLKGSDGRTHLGTPLKFTEGPGRPRLQVSEIGQHSAEILAEVGFAEKTINRFFVEGIAHSTSSMH